jgi:hypothetical protein
MLTTLKRIAHMPFKRNDGAIAVFTRVDSHGLEYFIKVGEGEDGGWKQWGAEEWVLGENAFELEKLWAARSRNQTDPYDWKKIIEKATMHEPS